MFTVKEVANRLNISPGAIYKAVRNGELQHHRFGASIRISEEQLTEYVEETRIRAEPDPLSVSEFKHL
ncbi:MAG: hypothetical protein Fues2KO_16800 [Fuerstiella sp.]